jgi:hypothetical protein
MPKPKETKPRKPTKADIAAKVWDLLEELQFPALPDHGHRAGQYDRARVEKWTKAHLLDTLLELQALKAEASHVFDPEAEIAELRDGVSLPKVLTQMDRIIELEAKVEELKQLLFEATKQAPVI